MKIHLHWKLAVVFCNFCVAVEAMFSKRPLPDRDEDMPPCQRLRQNIADLFLSNDVSGARAQTVMSDVNACGVEGFDRLAKTGNNGKCKKNAPRDIRRVLLRGNHCWPSP